MTYSKAYSMLWAAMAGACLLALIGPAARAQSNDNDGCSDRTLKGDYAFTVSGQIFMPGPNGTTVVIQRDGVAMTHFDGNGTLSQVDYVSSSPNAAPPPGPPPTDMVTGFHTDEKGTYKVFSDCTGTFTIASPNFVGTDIAGPVITVKFVLSNFGRSIHTIVTSLIPPGSRNPVPALIHSEGHKLGPIQD